MADIIKTVGDGHGTPDYATLTLWNAGEGGADPGAGFTSIANCSGFCGDSANINGTFIRGYEILGVDAAYDGTNDALLASTKSLTLTTANGLVEDLYITNVNLFAVALAFNAANTSVRRVFIDSAVNTSGGGGNCVSFSGALVAGRLLERFVIDGTNDNECIMGGFNREYTLNKGVLYNSKGTNATGSSSTQQVTDVYSADAVTADYGAGLELTSAASSDATGSAGLQNITLSSAIVNAGAKDFRSKSGGPLDGTGSVDFVGAFLEVGGGVTVTALLNSNYMVEYSMKKNVAGQSIGAQMVTISDGSDFTGTVTAEVTIDNGTKAAGGGSVTHEGEGYHSYAPTQAETNGDHIAFSFAGTGALTQTIQVYTTFPQTVDNDVAISALNDFDPTSDAVANVTLVATTTTNTDMRGTDSANTVVPPSVAQFNARTLASGDYFVVDDYTAPDNASITSILADTNELQLNQGNWLTATGFSTTAEIADVPTVAEFNARTLPSASYSQFDYTANEVSANIAKINGVTITGDGSGSPFDV